ncbi:hypothetical protein OOK13_12625 [Streptomyces sp. NBC_00378]|uniref:hypothetical protein n=1 Tax=unclassified Streptomyces TaxID=2593676 RepID=UPI002250ADEC|nr:MULTISPECIES: hypothetical protein [unclassified Streptomyces]MCX5109361.1 hypothetical protein [Streptomyces sp. NBC_00378]
MKQNRFRALAVSVAAVAAVAFGLTHAQGDAMSGLRSVAEQPRTGDTFVVIARAEPEQWMWTKQWMW